MPEFEVSREEAVARLAACPPDMTDDSEAKALRTVVALHKTLGMERVAAARVQSVGRQLLEDVKVRDQIIERLRNGWVPWQDSKRGWQWFDDRRMRGWEPMAPEEQAVITGA
jgi:hypothetical protein